jgi:hypothetical protein
MSGQIFFRALRTPLSDLVRGKVRLHASNDSWRTALAATGLPADVQSAVATVVGKTRLWPAEQAEVMSELADHFSAALEEGIAAAGALSAFGDLREAAKLIRRGKLRNRPVWWRCWRYFRNVTAGFLIVYASMLAVYAGGSPSLTVDYVAQYTSADRAAPADQRGWPLYQQAATLLPRRGEFPLAFQDRGDPLYRAMEYQPGDPAWGQLVSFLEKYKEVVRLTRLAAERPVMGLEAEVVRPRGPKGPTYIEDHLGDYYCVWRAAGNVPDAIINRLPALVLLDAHVARGNGETARWLADVRAIIGMSRQSDLSNVVLGRYGWACNEVDRALITGMPSLDTGQLTELAHTLAASQVRYNLDSSRLQFYDIVQRTFTDDRNGDGHMTREGFLWWYAQCYPPERRSFAVTLGPDIDASVVYASSVPAMATRREIVAEFDRRMDDIKHTLSLPWWQADWQGIARAADARKTGPAWDFRHMPLRFHGPSAESVHRWAESVNGRLDGLTVAIACEIYRRRTGQFPDRLDQLVPALLPAVPPDRCDGQPLRYKLVDGKPLIYSVGDDKIDGGGKLPVDSHYNPDPFRNAIDGKDSPPQGDWILYPDPELARQANSR